jgi:hypothetical protein
MYFCLHTAVDDANTLEYLLSRKGFKSPLGHRNTSTQSDVGKRTRFVGTDVRFSSMEVTSG